MRTYSPKASEIQRAWYVVDAEGLVLGRLATEVARLLRGKHKPTFAPHIDTGDHVIVVNADKVVLTVGQGRRKKVVYRHSGYPGGIKRADLRRPAAPKPAEAVRRRPGHAAEGPPRPPAAHEAQGLRRRRPPARRPAAQASLEVAHAQPRSDGRNASVPRAQAAHPVDRPPQAGRRPRAPASRHGQDHRQRPRRRRLLPVGRRTA